MNFKNKVIQHINEEDWKSRNTKDIDGLKKIQRALMREYASNNKKIFRDDAIKIAKETNPNEQKKFVRYINNAFSNDKYLTYKEFVNRLVKNGTIESDIYDIKKPSGYENKQVLDTVKNIGANISKNIETILLKHYDKNPSGIYEILRILDLKFHFDGVKSFFRYNKPSDNWIHISAAQTDFFNKVRELASNSQRKEFKKVFSEILSKEEDVYKAIFSKLVNENKDVRYFTFNSPNIVRKIEKIKSDGNISIIYSSFPSKLGFVKKPFDDKNILRLKNFNESFFHKLKTRVENKKVNNDNYIWFATRDMVNENENENNTKGVLLEMALPDLKNISKDAIEQLDFVRMTEEYVSSIRKRAKKENKDYKKTILSGTQSLINITKNPIFLNAIKQKNLEDIDIEAFIDLLMLIYEDVSGVYIGLFSGGHHIVIESKKSKDFLNLLKNLSLNLVKNNKYKKSLKEINKIIPNAVDESTFIEILENKDEQKIIGILSINYDEKINKVLYNYLIKSKKNFMFIFTLAFSNYDKIDVRRVLSTIESIAGVHKNSFTIEDTKKALDTLLAIRKTYNFVTDIFPSTHFISLAIDDNKYRAFLEKRYLKLLDTKDIEKNVIVKNIKALNHFNISTDRKIQLLKNSGFSQEEINKIIPNREITKKEKGFSKKVLGESSLDRAFNFLSRRIYLSEGLGTNMK